METAEALQPAWRERDVLSVPEAGVVLGLPTSTAYRCAAQGQIPTIRVGRRLLVPVARLAAMLDRPPAI